MTAAIGVEIRAVLFDLDGTLVEPMVVRVQRETIAAFGGDLDEQALLEMPGTPFPQKLEALFSGIDRPLRDALNRAYRETLSARVAETPQMPGAAGLLEALDARGIAMGVISNKPEAGARELIAAMDWSRYFGPIVGRDTAEAQKPDASPARHALVALGVEPAHAALVGDAVDDMGCGQAAGCAAVVGISSTSMPEVLRAAGATHVCDSLDDVRALLLAEGAAGGDG